MPPAAGRSTITAGCCSRQPWTAVCFLGGAVAICGLPPLNGFVSEWLIYLAAFGALSGDGLTLRLAVLAAPALALIGGLALACFVKVFGVAFLGAPRTAGGRSRRARCRAEHALGRCWRCWLVCAWIGLLPGDAGAAAAERGGQPGSPLARRASSDGDRWRRCRWSAPSAGCCCWLSAVAWLVAAPPHARRRRATCPTWGCGYAWRRRRACSTPPRRSPISWSASSASGSWTERHGGKVRGLFPAAGTVCQPHPR